MKLFHGSDIKVPEPDIERGRPYKDFGRGFYLSASKQQAMNMAQQKAELTLDRKPVVSTYDFDEAAMTDGTLRVKRFETYTEEWAEFVLRNRNRKTPQPPHDYDIVFGPIADDTIVRQMRRFELGDITLQELMEGLKYPQGITFQYYFGSQKALDRLKFLC